MVRPEFTSAPVSTALRWILWVLPSLLLAVGNAISIERAILEDVLPEGSPKCTDGNTTTVTFKFSPSDVSGWSETSKPWEELNFLAQIHHQDSDPNRTWTMRISRGGNIYSLVGPYGEAIPSQKIGNAVWVDDVIMGVSVDISKNNDAPGRPWFVHQAGTYMSDSDYTPPPFFSPNIAKHCNGHACNFASWGQQAHIPTTYKSDMLFFYTYRDCGDGIIEYTQGFQNNADPAAGGDVTNFQNIPWGGVRTTTFPYLLLSNSEGLYEPPLQYWGDDLKLPKLAATGGFATFAQHALTAANDTLFTLPCYRETNVIPACSENDIFTLNFTQFTMIVPTDNPCTQSQFHSMHYGRNFVKCLTHGPTVPRIDAYLFWFSTDKKLVFTNRRTGKSAHVYDVIHWSFGNQLTYFSTNSTAEELNKIFRSGDEVIVYSSSISYPETENLALTMVHGLNEEYEDSEKTFYTRPSQFRYGMTGRDFYVATVRSWVRIEAGNTYFNRQYLISDQLQSMKERVHGWVEETRDDMFDYNDFNGRVIELYSKNNEEFGAAAADKVGGNETSCIHGIVRCVGYSTPRNGMKAFFAITCGNRSYFGPDQYAFSPKRNATNDGEPSQEPVRSYACDGEEALVRPQWKLLGYFPLDNSGCASLKSAKYKAEFCQVDNPTADNTPPKTLTSDGDSWPLPSPRNQTLPATENGSQPTTSPTTSASSKKSNSSTTAIDAASSNSSTLGAFQMLALSLNLIFGAMDLP